MGSTDPVVAIVERMMEQLQKDNPGVDYKRKPKKEKPCKKPKRKSSLPSRSSLH
jgi:hypothetical protein